MAEKATIARPYAQAAFDYARGKGSLADWSVLLEAGAQVAADERVARLLGSPHVTAAQLADLFLDAAGAGDPPRRNFIATLAANGRLGLLPEIPSSSRGCGPRSRIASTWNWSRRCRWRQHRRSGWWRPWAADWAARWCSPPASMPA